MTSYRDWVVELSNTTGTGAYQLAGPPAGTSYFTFRQRYSDGEDEVVFWTVNADRTKWEKNSITTLTYGAPDSLTRNVVESTDGDGPVSWVDGDLPLRLYVVPDATAQQGAITQWLAAARSALLRFGMWWKSATPAAGYNQLNLYDGTSDIPIGVNNETSHQVTLYGTPRDYLRRTIARNGGTPTTKVDVTYYCMDSTNTVCMQALSAITKRTNGAWVAGNDANGMGIGLTIGNNAFYHVFAIIVNGLADAYIDTSVTAANKPAGTSYFRRLGSVRTNGSAQLLGFTQVGDEFWLDVTLADYTGQGMTAGGATDTLTISAPPGVRTIWHGHAQVVTTVSGGAVAVSFHPAGLGGGVPNAGGGTNGTATTLATGSSDLHILTNTASNISGTASGSSVTMSISTHGWRELP